MRCLVPSEGAAMVVAALALAVWVGTMILPAGALAGPPEFRITTRDGAPISLAPEELRGPAARPLLATRDRLRARFGRELLWFFRAAIADGTPLVGRWTADRGLTRLTLYEITKNDDTPRHLRVVGSRVYRKADTAEFRVDLRKFKEHVYLITAEAVTSAEELNPHLRYMSTQGDAILLQGFSTNWNLTTLRFRMAEKAPGERELDFARDADWLVNNLIEPQWVVSIRVE